jgi:hypothetical protein
MLGSLVMLHSRVSLFAAFGAWQELGGLVATYEKQLLAETGQKPLVIAEGKYRLASVLAFYRDPANVTDHTTSQWIMDGKGLGYPYWLGRDQWLGRDCIFVSDGQDALVKTEGHFESVQLMTNVSYAYTGGRHYQVAICRGLLK